MTKINSENFFEWTEAIHCFCTLNHSGQSSELYSILSLSDFRPGPLWSESRCVAENEFYSELNEENIFDVFSELQCFLNSRENKND